MSAIHLTENLVNRFYAGVIGSKQPNGCILWTKGKSTSGYGIISFRRVVQIRAHRLSYAIFVGPFPNDLNICHRCDTPACVNPTHLFVGTHQDNVDDRQAKGRSSTRKGDRCHLSKLRADDILAIRDLRAKGFRHWEIARFYGVKRSNIGAILKGISWKHV